jgi:hypothetical protein
MPHLRLVPPLAPADAVPSPRVAPPAEQAAYDDPTVVALSFFEAASGLCLCRSCSKKRHPAFGQ